VPATGYALASGMGENSGMGVWIAANEEVVALGRREAVRRVGLDITRGRGDMVHGSVQMLTFMTVTRIS
jgi:hypothetical protein